MPFCANCGTSYVEVCNCIKSKPSARMPEQSNAEALAGDSSVPGDSHVSSAVRLQLIEVNRRFVLAQDALDSARRELTKLTEQIGL